MPREPFRKRLFYFLRTVILIDLVLFAIAAFVCLLLGWHSMPQYGQSLIWGSMLAFLLGASGVITSLGLGKSPDYQYAQSVGQAKMSENARRAVNEGQASYGFLLLMATVGLIAFAAGVLLQSMS
jgi:hypothetical protein